MKKLWSYALAFFASSLFAAFFFRADLQAIPLLFEKETRAKPNILIVSVCSMRLKQMGLYDYERNNTPNLSAVFSENSFVFTNAFNSQSWAGLFSYFLGADSERLLSFGYHFPMSEIDNVLYMAMPPRASLQYNVPRGHMNDNLFHNDLKPYLDYMQRTIAGRHPEKPFFMLPHLMYMHYPLIDVTNADSEWDFYLSSAERKRLEGYLAEPLKFTDKLPLFLLLHNEIERLRDFPQIQAQWDARDHWKNFRFLGLVNDAQVIEAWKNSEGYQEDLVVLKKIYDANIRYLDRSLGPLLNFYGDKELRENTIVIFLSDHGESLMENGILTHGASVGDTVLRIPLAVKFPSGKKRASKRIETQFYLGELADLLEGLMAGRITEKNFEASVTGRASGILLARSCDNSQAAVRQSNRWKLVMDFGHGSRRLYDLRKDPEEENDISDENAQKVQELEALYWRSYKDFKKPHEHDCAPWP